MAGALRLLAPALAAVWRCVTTCWREREGPDEQQDSTGAPAPAQQQQQVPEPPAPAGPRSTHGRGRPPPPLAIRDARIVDADTGDQVEIRGINWFGFNVGQQMVDGLWAGGADHATDFAKIAWQLPALGFNTVRLPFRWKDMGPAPGRDTQCRCSSKAEVRLKLTDPAALARTQHMPLPDNPAPICGGRRGWANTYLPATGWDRLLWVTQYFVAQGMYVVLDYQPMGTEQQAHSVEEFSDAWVKLWQAVCSLPNFQSDLKGRVIIDLMNEPDSMGLGWERRGDKPGTTELFLTTMDKLWDACPAGSRPLFFVEGTGQTSYGLNWGNGFVTDRQLLAAWQLSDPNPFFQQLLQRPYARSVIITPHCYPPSITGGGLVGQELFCRLSKSLGYLSKQGYQGPRLPVVIGEFGSAFATGVDRQWLGDFAKYLNNEDEGADGSHEHIGGWMWWAYNANSGDTGGIVNDDWQGFNWQKLNYLGTVGLRPWFDRA